MNIREELAEELAKIPKGYLGITDPQEHNRKLKYAKVQVEAVIAIFKEFIETMELPIHTPKYNCQPTPYGWIEGAHDLLKAIKEKLELRQ